MNPPPPPVEYEAERAVLGAFLLEGALVAPYVDTLDLTVFHKEQCRLVWSTLRTLYRAGSAIDTLTVRAELRRRGVFAEAGGDTFLAVLQEEGAVATQVAPLVALLREAALRREVLELGGRLITGATTGQSISELLDTLGRFTPRHTAPPPPAEPLSIGLGTFLAQRFDPLEAIVEGLLYTDSSGFIAGEEKLGKSYYAVEEALSIALGIPVCGRFAVPTRRRVVFIEEEDPPRRLHARLCALLRGKGYDPTDPAVWADLDQWMQVAAWTGFSFDTPELVARLEVTCQTFKPKVIYGDVLRKLTLKDLNKGPEAGALLATLDRLRRTYGVVFRILHHFRKAQGFRVSRGSQELGGSFHLGAWSESSLFFEPIGRTQRSGVKVEVQTKDAPPRQAFLLLWESEGPDHDPLWVKLRAEEEVPGTVVRARNLDLVLEALQTTPPTPLPLEGIPGVSVADLVTVVKLTDKTIRSLLKELEATGRAQAVGKLAKNAVLWAATPSKAS